jgi:succinate dehydrogenase/fumarate reductase cytochrome b subunit
MNVGGFAVRMDAIRESATPKVTHRNRRLLIGLGVIIAVCLIIYLFFWSGLFTFQPEEGETFWHLLHQKGHWYLEVFISGVETILFDVIIGLVGWRFLLKPYIAERQAQAIAAEHALHGIEDHDHAAP